MQTLAIGDREFAYEVKLGGLRYPGAHKEDRGQPRFLFADFKTAKGAPIRFKSLDRAERHIRNVMKLRSAQ